MSSIALERATSYLHLHTHLHIRTKMTVVGIERNNSPGHVRRVCYHHFVPIIAREKKERKKQDEFRLSNNHQTIGTKWPMISANKKLFVIQFPENAIFLFLSFERTNFVRGRLISSYAIANMKDRQYLTKIADRSFQGGSNQRYSCLSN